MTGVQTALVIILVVCIVLSGFFSGSETAVVALPRERSARLAGHGTRGARLAALVNDLESTLGTLLVANNFVNILGASVAAALTIDLLELVVHGATAETFGPWVSTLVMTAVVLVVGEITPKTLAARRPEQFGLFVAPTIWWLGRTIRPIPRAFVGLSRSILRRFGVDSGSGAAVTEADIKALAVLGEEAGHIDPAKREILESLFGMADRPVREVMTPRLEVAALSLGDTEEDARRAINASAHSRFPVVTVGGTLDDIVGILYAKDLFRSSPGRGPIDRFLRDPVYLPESMPILAALQQLRRQRISFGVVLDEHGGVDGIVTVKDLIAELVGDIQDEYDPREPTIFRMGDQMWMVEGRVPVEELAGEIGVPLPSGPFSSVGGLYLWAAGVIPEIGQTILIDGVRLTVLRMDRKRIDRLRVELAPS
ncbi:MAG TPA: hemolysin family protein [Acidimicrobiia bacterium]|nr:hemolysin family protein [Acidimicrobiia bacterium]